MLHITLLYWFQVDVNLFVAFFVMSKLKLLYRDEKEQKNRQKSSCIKCFSYSNAADLNPTSYCNCYNRGMNHTFITITHYLENNRIVAVITKSDII